MAKHCTNCGHELRETDKFCAECGTAVGGGAPQAPQIQWEYCEIFCDCRKVGWFPGLSDFYVFYATGIGPRGTFAVPAGDYKGGSSDIYPTKGAHPRPSDENSKAVNTLVAVLVGASWEPLPGKGQDWFSYKFRRPFRG
jgi:zinc ribbon protein